MKYLLTLAVAFLGLMWATPYVEAQEVSGGVIRVVVDTTPETPDVNFDFQIRDVDDKIPAWTVSEFTLEDEGKSNTKEFVNLPHGRYRVTAFGMAGWRIVDSECKDLASDATFTFSGAVEGIVTIDLRDDSEVECQFTYERLPTPTPTPTATATPVPTSTPVPTATPAPAATPVVVIVEAPAPATVPAVVAPVIKPPSTGDGGLR